jgi:hypothetical protein
MRPADFLGSLPAGGFPRGEKLRCFPERNLWGQAWRIGTLRMPRRESLGFPSALRSPAGKGGKIPESFRKEGG